MKSGRPLILGAGIPEDVLELVERDAARELLENRVAGYIRVEGVYGRKRVQ